MASYIGVVLQMCFRDVSHQKKEEPSSMKYTLVIVDIMPALVRLWLKPTDMASIGSQHMRMQKI